MHNELKIILLFLRQMDLVKRKQFEILSKSLDTQKSPILERIAPIRTQIMQFMFDHYIEDFQQFDRYCRYNHYTYDQAISADQEEVIDERVLAKAMAESNETNQRVLDLEILRFNTLKSKNSNSKNLISETHKKEVPETRTPVPVYERPPKKWTFILEVKEEDLEASNFFNDNRAGNEMDRYKSAFGQKLKKSVPIQKVWQVLDEINEYRQLVEEEALTTFNFD